MTTGAEEIQSYLNICAEEHMLDFVEEVRIGDDTFELVVSGPPNYSAEIPMQLVRESDGRFFRVDVSVVAWDDREANKPADEAARREAEGAS